MKYTYKLQYFKNMSAPLSSYYYSYLRKYIYSETIEKHIYDMLTLIYFIYVIVLKRKKVLVDQRRIKRKQRKKAPS